MTMTMLLVPDRSCPVLWRIYIAHHMNAGQLEPARKVFLRAIHECPWSKVILQATGSPSSPADMRSFGIPCRQGTWCCLEW